MARRHGGNVHDEDNLELLLQDDNPVFGFDNLKLARESQKLAHHDDELRAYLSTGFRNCSERTPLVCTVSPHPAKVMNRAKEL